MLRQLLPSLFALALVTPAFAGPSVEVRPTAELGFASVLSHRIQIGEGTYRFDYRREGGQELLQLYARLEVGLALFERHEVALLYQPLTFRTSSRVDAPGGITIDDVTFADGTPLDLKYGFDFFRLTYRYRFVEREGWRFSAGGALQLRNASIVFDGFDAGQDPIRAITQDFGFVPVISLALRRTLPSGLFIESTLEGFYAPLRYLNLRDVDVVGWLYDAALLAGVPFVDLAEAFISIRFLGGGADGTGRERRYWTESRAEPRYTFNDLNLAVVTLGARLVP